MLSELHVIMLSLLLLMCGQHLQQAHAANSGEALEEASIISGRYFDTLGGNYRILTWRPVDITALNQYLPILFEREVNGIMDRPALILSPGDGTYAYYNFTDVEYFRATIRPNLASLTLEDLPSEPECKGNQSLVDNQVIKSSNCGPFAYSFIHTCTSETTTVHNNGPHIPSPLPIKTKLQSLPLPDSWLVGQTECINPCGY